MSLKAKIEAVIYASEEPVTLAQLISLLGEEGQAELDALASNQLSLGTEESSAEDHGEDADSLNAEVLDTSEVAAEAPYADAVAEPEVASEPAAPDAKALAAAEKVRARKLREHFRLLLDQMIADCANEDRGLEVREVAGGFRLATKPEYHDAVRGFVKSLKPPLKLSLQALETLAVVAYKEPVTSPEVSEIRGVESAGTLGSLLARKLVTTAGRKQVIGRPILYKTTKDFLLRFGLKDINELPSIEEFERMAGELNEAVQEEIQMEEHAAREAESVSEQAESEEPGAETTDSPALDELHAVPTPTHAHHETPEDILSDDSSAPEGHEREPA